MIMHLIKQNKIYDIDHMRSANLQMFDFKYLVEAVREKVQGLKNFHCIK